jgi:DNA-binding NarL/FixJ family response regulator
MTPDMPESGRDRETEPVIARRVRVLIADDEALIRGSLRVLLDAEPDLDVVGEAADGAEAIRAVAERRPDVILMDIRMPGIDGIQATSRIAIGPSPRPRTLILTTFGSDDYLFAALEAGARGFILKRAAPDDLVRAIRTVAHGEALVLPEFAREHILAHRGAPDPRRQAAIDRLTPREREVLTLVAQGCSNAEIANQLFLGLQTVKTHVTAILSKLGARDRTQAVVIAYESGFVRGRA